MKPVVPARPLVVAIVLAALAAGGVVIALELASDHQDPKALWAIFGPAVGWSFIGTGLYAWRRKPDSRIGALMILLGFAWFLFTLDAANSPLLYTVGLVLGGLWGSLFLHIGVSFPTGRLQPTRSTAGWPSPATSSSRWRRCQRCCSPRRTTSAATTARRTCCSSAATRTSPAVLDRPRRAWPTSCSSRRARVGGAALAADAAHRAPAAHAGVRLLAAHLRARDGGPGGGGRRGAVAGVHRRPC